MIRLYVNGVEDKRRKEKSGRYRIPNKRKWFAGIRMVWRSFSLTSRSVQSSRAKVIFHGSFPIPAGCSFRLKFPATIR